MMDVNREPYGITSADLLPLPDLLKASTPAFIFSITEQTQEIFFFVSPLRATSSPWGPAPHRPCEESRDLRCTYQQHADEVYGSNHPPPSLYRLACQWETTAQTSSRHLFPISHWLGWSGRVWGGGPSQSRVEKSGVATRDWNVMQRNLGQQSRALSRQRSDHPQERGSGGRIKSKGWGKMGRGESWRRTVELSLRTELECATKWCHSHEEWAWDRHSVCVCVSTQ